MSFKPDILNKLKILGRGVSYLLMFLAIFIVYSSIGYLAIGGGSGWRTSLYVGLFVFFASLGLFLVLRKDNLQIVSVLSFEFLAYGLFEILSWKYITSSYQMSQMMPGSSLIPFPTGWAFVSIFCLIAIFSAYYVRAAPQKLEFFRRNVVGLTKTETPLDILKTRYAKGEVTKEQFESMKKDLR